MEVGLGLCDFVLDGDPAPPRKKAHPTQFSAHVYCGQTAGWMKTLLGTEVDLRPGHIVLDGDSAPLPQKGLSSPLVFGPCLLWPRSPISAAAELLFCRALTWVCTVCRRYVLGRCERLTELSVDLNEGQLDLETLDAISKHCRELQLLHLYGLKDQGLYRAADAICFISIRQTRATRCIRANMLQTRWTLSA